MLLCGLLNAYISANLGTRDNKGLGCKVVAHIKVALILDLVLDRSANVALIDSLGHINRQSLGNAVLLCRGQLVLSVHLGNVTNLVVHDATAVTGTGLRKNNVAVDLGTLDEDTILDIDIVVA